MVIVDALAAFWVDGRDFPIMKKPYFIPPAEFESKPSLPDDPVGAARLFEDLMDQVESNSLRAAQMQEVFEQGSLVRLGRLIRAKTYFQTPPKTS